MFVATSKNPASDVEGNVSSGGMAHGGRDRLVAVRRSPAGIHDEFHGSRVGRHDVEGWVVQCNFKTGHGHFAKKTSQ